MITYTLSSYALRMLAQNSTVPGEMEGRPSIPPASMDAWIGALNALDGISNATPEDVVAELYRAEADARLAALGFGPRR